MLIHESHILEQRIETNFEVCDPRSFFILLIFVSQRYLCSKEVTFVFPFRRQFKSYNERCINSLFKFLRFLATVHVIPEKEFSDFHMVFQVRQKSNLGLDIQLYYCQHQTSYSTSDFTNDNIQLRYSTFNFIIVNIRLVTQHPTSPMTTSNSDTQRPTSPMTTSNCEPA